MKLNKKIAALFGVVILSIGSVSTAQSPDELSVDDFMKQLDDDFAAFKDKVNEDYNTFRDKVNKEYEDFMRNPWTPTEIKKPLPPPVRKEKPKPDVVPEEEENKPVIKQEPVVIKEVVAPPAPKPQPKPVEPIKEVPVIKTVAPITLNFYGTEMSVRKPDFSSFHLAGNNENAFADGWKWLSNCNNNNLIVDCLKVRDKYQLPDWGYIQFLDKVAAQAAGKDTNEKTMLLGYLLNQSGYKVRFAYDASKKLHMLFNSNGILYNKSRYYVDGEWFYSYTKPEGTQVYICKFVTPKEQSVDMGIHKEPLFNYKASEKRVVKTKYHPELVVSLAPNKNLIDFFNDYPDATVDQSPYSKWAIHGNTPVSKEVREQLYPVLRKAVEGKSQYDGVGLLLKVAQSFPYGYDDEIWGNDRAFFMEESWYYPESDCEDHAVNFSHMVRDIMGLDVCLVYYPGHLSACVAFTDPNVKGDYIDYKGRRYTVCDATYFYASVGKTAPSNNNAEAILVPLSR